MNDEYSPMRVLKMWAIAMLILALVFGFVMLSAGNVETQSVSGMYHWFERLWELL